jgi:glycosyltransferase involved in cell wall biosynthesis
MMKTVAIISNQAFSLVNFRGALIKRLVGANICVYALAPDFTDEFREKVSMLGATPVDFRLARAGVNPWRDVLDMLGLAVLLRSLRPDVALGYSIKPVIYGTLAAWLARVPHRVAMIEGLGYVFTPTGLVLSWSRRLLRRAVSWLYRIALARAHQVIFLNDDDVAEFVAHGLVAKNKVVRLGGIGVDLNEWLAAPQVAKPVTFLLAARLLREKGIAEYAEAAKMVKGRHPEVHFVLLGGLDQNPGGLSQPQVEAWVNEGVLEWPGHVDVKPWLAQASVFVLPSYREGVPRSTQEAMAMGRAVITTDVPGCRETVVDGVNGYMVPVRSAAALAEAMIKFIKNPDSIKRMGLESRRLAEERFDVHKVNARMMSILFGEQGV